LLRQKNVVETLVRKYPLYNLEKRTSPKRLGNLDNVPINTLVDCVYNTFKCLDIEILSPDNIKNPSNTFDCIRFVTDDFLEYFIVNCNRENKGKIFEDSLYNLLSKNDPSVNTLLEYLGISGKPYKVFNTGTVNTARNIYDQIRNSGEIISDITIVCEGVEHYLSLKAKNGRTIYSGKIINFITEQFGKIDFDPDNYFTSPHGALFDTLNMDVYKVIDGLYDYMNGNDKPGVVELVESDAFPFLHKMLVNSWSYGYHLIYEHSKVVKALDLTTPDNVNKLVNKIIDAKIIYPNYKSKQLSIHINVHNDILNTIDLYHMEFRNTKGRLLPLEMKVRKM
jgi:hypothetical protein